MTQEIKMTSFSEYQWLNEAFSQIQTAFQRGKMAHGLMVVSPEGSGKRAFADQLAKSINCKLSKQQLNNACGQCKNCLLIESNSYPDLSILDCLIDNKGKQKNSIGIDQVRSLTDKLVETPQMGGWRVAIIASVEKLTRGAFNALLKTLEEPGDRTLLLMLANSAHRVPATIKSRCQLVPFSLKGEMLSKWLVEQSSCTDEQAEYALEQCLYSPFKSLEFIKESGADKIKTMYADLDAMLATRISPNQFVAKYADLNDQLWIQIANFFLHVQLCILESNQGNYSAVPKTMASDLYASLLEYNRAQCAGSNLQAKLQLEIILIPWFELGRKIVHYSSR